MRRVRVLLVGLLLCAGCASTGARGPWDEALRDLRGDNRRICGFGDAEDQPRD